jgi:hypothetical protein
VWLMAPLNRIQESQVPGVSREAANERPEPNQHGGGRGGHCESVLGQIGSLYVSSRSPHSMRAIHYVPWYVAGQQVTIVDYQHVDRDV